MKGGAYENVYYFKCNNGVYLFVSFNGSANNFNIETKHNGVCVRRKEKKGGGKKMIKIIVIFIFLFLQSSTVFAFDYLKFALGVGSGYVIHEAAHQAVAEVNGTPFKWKNGFGSTWITSNNTSNSERYELASAGLGSQVLSTEIILNTKDIPKDNEYVIGILTFNVLNALLYVVSDGVMNPHDNYGDIEMMDKAGLDRDYVNTFLVVHSLYTIYRVYYKTDIPVYMTMSKNEIKVGVTIFRW